MLDFSYDLTFTNIHRPGTLVAELADTTMEGVRPVFLRSFARFLAQEEYRFCAEGNGISAALTAADAAIWAEFTRSLGLREGSLAGINYADLEARVVASMGYGSAVANGTPASTTMKRGGFAVGTMFDHSPTGRLHLLPEMPQYPQSDFTFDSRILRNLREVEMLCPLCDAGSVAKKKKPWSKRHKHIGKLPKG